MLEFILSYITVQDLIWLVVALPFFGFIVNAIISFLVAYYGYTEPKGVVKFVSVFAALLSLVVVALLAYILYGLEGSAPSVVTGPLFSWKGFFDQPLEFGLKLDQLSLAVVFVLSGLGLLTAFYSVGFFSREKSVSGYFSILGIVESLSILLVLTDNFFLFFVAWQLLSVAGMVFINRFFSDKSSIQPAIVYYTAETLSGAGLLIVMFLIWKAFLGYSGLGLDIFQFNSIQTGAGLLLPFAFVVCISLLFCIVVRSLQFPFYIWIVDISRAALPLYSYMFAVCSALISIYILIRLNFLLILSPKFLTMAGVLGALGALFGSASMLAQKDAKKLLAYFMLSQVGLAFIAIGVGAFATAIFHILTYAVYITAVFFGVGSVFYITGMENLDNFGDLRKKLPVTFWATLVGVFSASGIYPFAGFFGKMGVLWEAYQRGHTLLFFAGFFAAIFAAISLFRLVALMFYKSRQRAVLQCPVAEESSVSMLVSMVIISFFALVLGWFSVPAAFGGEDHLRMWLEPSMATQVIHQTGSGGDFSELVLGVFVILFVVHAGFITWIVYVQKRAWANGLAGRFKKVAGLLENGFYLNKIYSVAIVLPVRFLGDKIIYRGFNKLIVNGIIVDSVGRSLGLVGQVLERFKVTSMAVWLGLLLIMLVAFIGWTFF